MPEQIALIETPIYETTGTPGPRVLHELCRFDLLGTLCRVHVSGDGDTLDLSIGRRRFALSVLDLAATAALAVEAHIKREIVTRVVASRATPAPARDADVEDDGFITIHPATRRH